MRLEFENNFGEFLGDQVFRVGTKVFDCIFSFLKTKYAAKYVDGALKRSELKFGDKIKKAQDYYEKEIWTLEGLTCVILPDQKSILSFYNI